MFIHPNILPGSWRIVILALLLIFPTYAGLGFSFVELISCPSGQCNVGITLVDKWFETNEGKHNNVTRSLKHFQKDLLLLQFAFCWTITKLSLPFYE